MDEAARPAGGYICGPRGKDAKRDVPQLRRVGERTGRANKDGTFADGKAAVKALESGTSTRSSAAYDLDYKDVKRAERFIGELKRSSRRRARCRGCRS